MVKVYLILLGFLLPHCARVPIQAPTSSNKGSKDPAPMQPDLLSPTPKPLGNERKQKETPPLIVKSYADLVKAPNQNVLPKNYGLLKFSPLKAGRLSCDKAAYSTKMPQWADALDLASKSKECGRLKMQFCAKDADETHTIDVNILNYPCADNAFANNSIKVILHPDTLTTKLVDISVKSSPSTVGFF